jgi:hypothetical protein
MRKGRCRGAARYLQKHVYSAARQSLALDGAACIAWAAAAMTLISLAHSFPLRLVMAAAACCHQTLTDGPQAQCTPRARPRKLHTSGPLASPPHSPPHGQPPPRPLASPPRPTLGDLLVPMGQLPEEVAAAGVPAAIVHLRRSRHQVSALRASLCDKRACFIQASSQKPDTDAKQVGWEARVSMGSKDYDWKQAYMHGIAVATGAAPWGAALSGRSVQRALRRCRQPPAPRTGSSPRPACGDGALGIDSAWLLRSAGAAHDARQAQQLRRSSRPHRQHWAWHRRPSPGRARTAPRRTV